MGLEAWLWERSCDGLNGVGRWLFEAVSREALLLAGLHALCLLDSVRAGCSLSGDDGEQRLLVKMVQRNHSSMIGEIEPRSWCKARSERAVSQIYNLISRSAS